MTTSTEEINLYEILGVPRNATNDQIRSAYRRQALKCHPDKGGNVDLFNQLSKAYQILSNPTLRSRYDKSKPIPESILLPSLKVFSDCFNQWLKQSPLLEALFKDNCQDVLTFLNQNQNHPVMKIIINAMVKGEALPVNDIIRILLVMGVTGLITKNLGMKGEKEEGIGAPQ